MVNLVKAAKKIDLCKEPFYFYFTNNDSFTRTVGDTYFDSLKTFYYFQRQFIIENNLGILFCANNFYVAHQVIKRWQAKDFVKQMKTLLKEDKDFKECLNYDTYKKQQKLEINFFSKVKNFLIYHKMWCLLKLALKIRKG